MKNRLIFYYLLTMCALLSAKGITAQDTTQMFEFSLKQAQEQALANNLTVKNAKLDTDAAKKKVWETTTIGLPQVTGSLNYQKIFGEIPLFSLDSTGTESFPINERETSTYGLNISQLIFSGPYIVGLQASKTYKQLSSESLEKTEINIKEQVTQTYYRILLAEESNKILNSNKKNIQKTLLDSKALHKNGLIEETDVEQLQVATTMLENGIKSLERQIKSAYDYLKFLLGINLNNTIQLAESFDEIMTPINFSTISQNTTDIENHIDYKMLKTQEQLALLSLRREKTEYLPSVSAYYNYQDYVINAPLLNFTPKSLVGVNLSIPIFSSGMRYSKVQQAKIELKKAKNSRELGIQGLQLEIQEARSSFTTAFETYQSNRDNMNLAEKIYKITTKKYEQGMASSMDVTQANDKFLETHNAYTQSLVELLNAKIRLDKALNKL